MLWPEKWFFFFLKPLRWDDNVEWDYSILATREYAQFIFKIQAQSYACTARRHIHTCSTEPTLVQCTGSNEIQLVDLKLWKIINILASFYCSSEDFHKTWRGDFLFTLLWLRIQWVHIYDNSIKSVRAKWLVSAQPLLHDPVF